MDRFSVEEQAALSIARGAGLAGIEEAIFGGEIDAGYGFYLLELLERDAAAL
jgi:hypothetical protein